VLVLVFAGGAAPAQVGGPGPSNPAAGLTGAFAPNFYNRTQQPLSPYLNLLRGGSPAVNYFYGVRPGLPPAGSGGGVFGYQGPALGPPGTGNRFYLQPPTAAGEPPSQPLEARRELEVIPTAAHPVTFGNGPAAGGAFRAAPRTGFAAQQPPARRPAPRR
jgi:hypothetical protein